MYRYVPDHFPFPGSILFFSWKEQGKTFALLGIIALVLSVFPLPATASFAAGVLLTDDKGKVLVSRNENTSYIPASTLKLLTGLAAIRHFGPDFRFATPAAYDPFSGNLHIRGMGDPLFVSEIIRAFTLNLMENTGITDEGKVNDIVLDLSFFEQQIHIPGTGTSRNPYDATTGALCANFNTVAFQWDREKSIFMSAEPQTPLLPVFAADIRSTGLKKGRILLDPDQRRLYAGRLVEFFLAEQGIKVRGNVRQGRFPAKPEQITTYRSVFTMDQVIEKLLKFSNNFIANQLVLTMGARAAGEPANLEKGVAVLRDFASRELGLGEIRIAEGSGLSRKNRLTPAQMIQILSAFRPYHKLMRENKDEYYKTGTLSGIRCRAGYIRGKGNRLFPYVIMINEKNQGWEPVLRELIRKVRSSGTGS